ncbi:hypothetical protein OG496_33390 [Streptomyces sp. NBC_00988]|uniref:hypothetical protein n=1 Tax=Streptomyces sp. NBC_00988 TaxID=2903704 RepID=UPI003866E9DE|nr:hypothetical protein OG496_33390 [Streptomyces sp. NBC_00988]
MSTPPRPRLKSLTPTPDGPIPAELAPAQADLGDSKGVAVGVPTAVRPDPQQGDGRYPVAWLTICTPRGATPTARSTCLCGRDRRAFGARKVLALITEHAGHREHCPLRAPQEGRTAA